MRALKRNAAMALITAAVIGTMFTSTAVSANRLDPPTDSATEVSLVYTQLWNVLDGDEFIVTVKDEDTGETRTVARNGEDTYISSTSTDGITKTSYVHSYAYYTVSDADKKVIEDVLNVPIQNVNLINFSALKFDVSDDDGQGTVEQFKAGTNTEYYYFNASKEWTRVVVKDKKGQEKHYSITQISNDCPDDLFSIPKGYEVVSVKYKIEDTKAKKVYGKALDNEFTFAFSDGSTAFVQVQRNHDFYQSETNLSDNKTVKTMGLGAFFYEINEEKRICEKSDRRYDGYAKRFFDPAKCQLRETDGIKRVTEGTTSYLVETLYDDTNTYKFYWDGNKLAKVETTTNSGKVLSTTNFTVFSTTADSKALSLPTGYEVIEKETTIEAGEGFFFKD